MNQEDENKAGCNITASLAEAIEKGTTPPPQHVNPLLTRSRSRTYMKLKDKNKAIKGKDLINNLSRISGYPRYAVKDILYYLAAMTEMKLAQNTPVIIEGIGMIRRNEARSQVRWNDFKLTEEQIYMGASASLIPDKYLRAALNTLPDNCIIDWREVTDKQAVFDGISDYYNAKYGEDFEKIEIDRYGTKDDLEEGISIIEARQKAITKERLARIKAAKDAAAKRAKEEGIVKPAKKLKEKPKKRLDD